MLFLSDNQSSVAAMFFFFKHIDVNSLASGKKWHHNIDGSNIKYIYQVKQSYKCLISQVKWL